MQAEQKKTAPRCGCGGEVSEAMREMAEMFPALWPVPQCDECSEADAQIQREEKQKLEQAREERERVARLDCIPPEMQRTRIEHHAFNGGLWLRVEGWKPSAGRWLGLVGGAGECKTRCLALLAKKLILKGHRLSWTTMTEFQDNVDDLRGERSAIMEAQRYLRKCKRAPILVLDDIGKNTWTPTLERHFFTIIDHRKTHDLPVLWTANTSPMEILASGQLTRDRGAPLMGRLIEASKIEKV